MTKAPRLKRPPRGNGHEHQVPEDLTPLQALSNPLLLPLSVRMRAAHELLDAGEIDGYEALSLIVWGVGVDA
jgi:hypothetical protein